MIRFDVFPRGKKRCVTFSYDDGCDNDTPDGTTIPSIYGMEN